MGRRSGSFGRYRSRERLAARRGAEGAAGAGVRGNHEGLGTRCSERRTIALAAVSPNSRLFGFC